MRKTVVFDPEKDTKRCMEHHSCMLLHERLAKEYNGLPFELFCEWMDMIEEGLIDETVHTFEWDTEDFNEDGERKVGSRWEKYRK